MTTNFVNCVSTGTKMPEQQAREVDDLCKTLPHGCTFRTKSLVADAIQFEPGEQSEVSVLTTNSVDMSREVVLPEGIDLDHYRKNPVVLWAHDHERPVASCQWIKVHKSSLRAKTFYPPDGPELTQQAWQLTKSGILKAKSIGFIPRVPLREPSEVELSEHPEWKGAGVLESILLYEYSCVSVGCNQDALVEAINTKSIDAAILKDFDLSIPEVITPEIVQEIVKKGISLEEALAYASAKGIKHKKPKAKKSVNPSKLLADMLEAIELDNDRIIQGIVDNYRNRGRV